MNNEAKRKPPSFIGGTAMISIFFLSWMMVLRIVPSDWISWGFFIFWCFLGMYALGKERQK